MTHNRHVIREGLGIGIIGYITVALFYVIFDALAARGTFFTVNLLGLTTLRGLRDPAVLQLPIAIDGGAVVMFNAVHLIASLAIGVVVAWLVSQLEGPPAQRRLGVLLIAAGFFITIFGIGMLSAAFSALLPFWSVVLANVAAAIVGGLWVLRGHPGLIRSSRAAIAG